MELLFVVLGAFIIGLIARYTLPHRELTGALLIPASTTAVGALMWEICLWCGLKANAPWIWVITTVVAVLAAFGGSIWLTRRRLNADAEALDKALRG